VGEKIGKLKDDRFNPQPGTIFLKVSLDWVENPETFCLFMFLDFLSFDCSLYLRKIIKEIF
jgi:hypothetical protein